MRWRMCHILYWQFPKGSYRRIPLKIRPNEHQRWGSGNKVKSRKWTEITLTNFICFTTHNYQLLTPDGQGQVNGAKVNDGQRPEERKNNLNFMDFKVLHAVISSTIIPNQTQSDCYLQAVIKGVKTEQLAQLFLSDSDSRLSLQLHMRWRNHPRA